MRRLALLVLLLSAAAARAEAPARVVWVQHRGIFAVAGKLRARLPVTSDGDDDAHGPVIYATIKRPRPDGSVVVNVAYNCGGDADLTFSRATLDARLANAGGLALHEKKQHREAAVLFAHAAELQPDWELAATHLASAQAMAGDRDGAVATLRALAARNAPLVAWRLAADPDLASVADEADFGGGEGSATWAALQKMPVARAEARGLLAYVTVDISNFSDIWDWYVRVIDERSGKKLVDIPFRHDDGTCEQKRRCLGAARRINDRWRADLDRVLRGLGFTMLPAAAFVALSDDKGVFPGTRVGVVGSERAVRVVTGDRVLAEAHRALHWRWAVRLPGGVLVAGNPHASEDCGNSAWTELVRLPLPPG